jgi:hypothetical protein
MNDIGYQTRKGFHRHLVALAALIACAGASAQVGTATLRGQLSGGTAAGVEVTAVNTATGRSYRTMTDAAGGYQLVGLAPGSYEIRVAGGAKSAAVELHVGETASVDLSVAAQTVTIVGSAARQNVITSEVGTSVSREQIANLPQVTRNFLAFADLAPGVRFNVDAGGNTKLQSGAQNQDNVNVFIDGVGQKNYILRGGISGLDSTRGNAFPQSAIAEYKVISQNYKAEFDQVSSVAITAITKSGTNDYHGEFFYDRTDGGMTAYDPFQQKNKDAGVPRPNVAQSQFGFSVGGAIKRDVMHYFLSFDGKDIDTPRQVVAQRTDLVPAGAGIVPALLASQGAAVSHFKENLFFGKIDADIAPDQHVDLSLRLRDEKDLVAEDNKLSVPGNDKNRSNKETRIALNHEWTGAAFVNQARLGYEEYTWSPHSSATDPFFKYKGSPTTTLANSQDILFVGGSPDAQSRGQKGTFVSDDFAYTGIVSHSLKTGIKFKDLSFDLSGTARSVDIVQAVIDKTTGLPYYAGGLCTGTNITNGGNDSAQCHIDRAIAPTGVNFNDQQIGLYFQDDWKLSRQLELNLGVRWDYETNALNDKYATPADRVTALRGLDGVRWGITPPAGQTYAQSLAKGGVNIEDFISTGSSRKAFKGALQPRFGASFDVNGDRQTVVFGGWGRAYDRTMANHALDEKQKNAVPGGEIWLIKNDHKMPYTDQFSVGLRQAVAAWNVEVGYTHSFSHNQFNWYGGNRDANGGWATQSPIDPLWNGPVGYGTLILGDFITQAKTQTLYLSVDKPFTKSSGWGVTANYTHSDAKTTNRQWTNDIFNWTYGKGATVWYPSADVEKDRLIVAATTDGLIPFGFMVSGKLTVGSGLPYQITDCSAGWNLCVFRKGDGGSFTQFDLGVAKDVKIGFGTATFRVDVLNLFNKTNYGGYDSWGGGPGNPQNYLGGDNNHLGVPGSVSGPMRTFKLGIGFKW